MPVRRLPLIALACAIATIAACADTTPTAPGESGLDSRTGSTVSNDTGSHAPLPERVRVHGRVLVTTYDAARAPGDTLTGFAPSAGQRVTLYRNVLVDGQGVSVRFGEVTTGADGAFDFTGVPGGYYVLSLNVTPERFYGETLAYVAGTRADVAADIRVWRRPAP